MARAGAIGGLLGAALALATPAVAEPELQLAVLQDDQGLSDVTSDVAVSPDGRHVYASGDIFRTSPGFLVVLRRLPDGKLAVTEEHPLGPGVTRVVVPSDGQGVLALASAAGAAAIISFQRNAADGKLTWVEDEGTQLGGSVEALAVSRDGRRVYVTSPGQNTLLVYARDVEAGTLAFAQKIGNSDPGVTGLTIPTLLAVSPDDRHVYVSGLRQDGEEYRDTIVLLRREPDDSLTFVEALDLDVFASDLAVDMHLTPDGTELLVLDGGKLPSGGAALRRYARDPADGRLSFVASQSIEDPVFFVGSVEWFAVRPDGRRIFFSGIAMVPPIVAPVMAWSRDEAGLLAPIVKVSAGISAHGVVSPDGRYVYTSNARAVRVLVPEPGAGAAGAAAVLATLGISRRVWQRRSRAGASARA